MTNHIALSILLVFMAVALLRAFQLETKILIRGVLILLAVNYFVFKASSDYLQTGKEYTDLLFKEPVKPLNKQLALIKDSEKSSV
jgi:hypothetical protein